MFSKSCSPRRHKLEVGPIETATIGGEIIFIAPKTAGCGRTCGGPLIFVPCPLEHTGACRFLPPLSLHLCARQTLNTNCQERCHYERLDARSGQFMNKFSRQLPLNCLTPDTLPSDTFHQKSSGNDAYDQVCLLPSPPPSPHLHHLFSHGKGQRGQGGPT